MSEKSHADINPYAPPTTDALPARPLRRPASVKWAFVILMIKVLVITMTHWQIIQNGGQNELMASYREQPYHVLPPLLSLVGLFAMVIASRAVITYGIVGLALVLMTAEGVLSAWLNVGRDFTHLHALNAAIEKWAPIGLAALMLWLTYRFIGGRPSRRYHRVLSEDKAG